MTPRKTMRPLCRKLKRVPAPPITLKAVKKRVALGVRSQRDLEWLINQVEELRGNKKTVEE